MSRRLVGDTGGASGAFITGSNALLSQRCTANRTRHTRSQSMTMLIDACENGSPTPAIFIHHPQRKLYEVFYARCVGSVMCRHRAPGGIPFPRGTPEAIGH